MKKLLVVLLALGSVFSAAPRRVATTYYVGPGGTAANCSQAQNPATPWPVIYFDTNTGIVPLSCMSAGDHMQIMTGTYNQTIHFNTSVMNSGTAGNPIVVEPYAGAIVTVVPPSGTVPGDLSPLADFININYITVKGLVFDAQTKATAGITIDSSASHIRIESSEITRSAVNGLYTDSDYPEIVNNHIHDNGHNGSFSPPYGYGLYIKGAYGLFDGNEIDGNGRYGFQMYTQVGGLHDNIARNNKIHDDNVDTAASGFGAGVILGGSNLLFYDNLIYNESATASVVPCIDVDYAGPSGIQILHNTLYGCGGYGIQIGVDGGASGTVVKNNVIYGNTGTIQDSGSGTIQAGNVTANPMFVDVGSGNFRLAAGSPAIGAGVTVGAVTTDIEGTTVNSPPDAGAYVYNNPPGTILPVHTFSDTGDTGTTITITTSSTTTGNTLTLCPGWFGDFTVSSITSSTGAASFVDVGVGRLARPTNGYTECFLATGITGGATPTFTVNLTGSSSYSEVSVNEYTPSVLDTGIYSSGTATSGTVVSSGSLTPSVTDGMLVAYVFDNSGGTYSIPGYTQRTGSYPYYFDKIFGSSVGSGAVSATSTVGFTKASIIAFALKPNVVGPPNYTTSGALTLLSTFTSISVKADYTNDDNADVAAAVQYKLSSSGTWLDAYTPFIDKRATIGGVANPYYHQARVSIVGLVADTSYDVRVTFTDAQGVSSLNPVTGTISTLDLTPPVGSGTTYNAINSTQLNTDLALLNPGDVLNLSAAATYNAFEITRSGDATHWITVACTSGSAVINGTGVSANVFIDANYIVFKNCTVPSSDNTGVFVRTTRHHVFVQNNTFSNVAAACDADNPYYGAGITFEQSTNNVYAIGNTINSSALPTPTCTNVISYASPATGIQWFTDHTTLVVSENSIGPGFRDCISTDNGNNLTENVDILNNVCSGYKDDGPESKGSSINVRIGGNTSHITTSLYGNSCIATNTNSDTTQTGPVYIYRNYCDSTTVGPGGLTAFKVATASGSSSPEYFFHNSVDTHSAGANWDCFSIGVNAATGATMHIKNNICYSQNGIFLYYPGTGVVSDYNTFYNGGNDWAYHWNDGSDHTYNVKADLCLYQSQDCHSAFGNPLFDGSLHITSGPAFASGVPLANFNGNNSAWPGTPNMGAYQAVPCTPHHLAYVLQPSDAYKDASLGTVRVGIYSSTDVLCDLATNTITLTSTALASADLSIDAVAGYATWTDLSFTMTGSRTIAADADTLTGATSVSVSITNAPAGAAGTASRRRASGR